MRARWRAHLTGAAIGAAVAALVLSGCTGDTPETERGARTPKPDPVPSTPVEVCVERVEYWAMEALNDSYWAGLDWEQKGLTNAQRQLLDDVVHEARKQQKKDGLKAAKQEARRTVKRPCKESEGATEDSENWRPPPTAK